MRPPQLYAHLILSLRYALEKGSPQSDIGGFFGHSIATPLILNGIIRRPKSTKAPSMYEDQAPAATLDEFRAEAEEFLGRYEAGDLAPPPHQVFGDIGIKGWAKLHVTHFQHHTESPFMLSAPDFAVDSSYEIVIAGDRARRHGCNASCVSSPWQKSSHLSF